MNRFIVIVLDGFGVGYMKDVKVVRPLDVGANTCKHILEKNPEFKLPNLEKLGLMNALGKEIGILKFQENVTFGKAELTHFGADTFMGHQEIMGTLPKLPIKEGFITVINKVYEELKNRGYKVQIKEGKEGKFLIVNDALTIADNIEADLGQAYNITAALDIMPFEDVLTVGKIVREHSRVSRVITFGGEDITLENILNAVEEKGNGFIGINAPKSGVYNKGYQCIHLGYGINAGVQIPTILGKKGIDVTLLGKVADIVSNEYGKSISCVDTEEVLKLTIKEMKSMDKGFICTNVQETDLCGHRENVEEYFKKLSIADKYLGEIMKELQEDDILLVMADHGNDPTIGHSRHTREMVPLLVYGPKVKKVSLGIRNTLSDVGATVADYFGITCPENGTSFLDSIT
ncbi:phosphopentomutase [Clostridium sporogenes]|uniref:phosphopentomutase n=1 Tax=Clostridium sporogenes TaxID=1509 RepID=UPI0013D4E405|nr:phosphopentomutase [Clostridium sporogenes]NFL18314.1 phosphopentomutase [Clostridium sporogenes]NFN72988.1 phosphopentomutase [Clostridium sporogenes]NFV22835.1 phosphopentomutase [Clostridium sporogenes]